MSQPDQVIESGMTEAQTGETDPRTPEFGSVEETFLALEAPLLAYALRLLKETAMAQDIVQEAFVRLHADFESVREPRRWLYRTVHNLAINQQRRDSRVVPLHPISPEESALPDVDLADPGLLPDEQITRLENIGLVRLSLGTLDEHSQELVRLKFTEGLTYKEMSERTGLSVSNIGYILHHSLKTIEAELTRSGVIS